MKEKYCDLHIHTNYSDGNCSPETAISRACFNELDLIAITDHDSCDAYLSLDTNFTPIRVIPGAEISTLNYHLLALNFNPFDTKMQEFLKRTDFRKPAQINEAIETTHNAGGSIGVAHFEKDMPKEGYYEGLKRFLKQGIDFLEVQPNDKWNDYSRVKSFAREHSLPLTYGSDFHCYHRGETLKKGENKISEELFELLNQGYVKIPA